jgi:hypothetical protein
MRRILMFYGIAFVDIALSICRAVNRIYRLSPYAFMALVLVACGGGGGGSGSGSGATQTPTQQSGTTVYDSIKNVYWLANANLAGDPSARAQIPLSSANPDGSTPVLNPDGTMDYQTALNWVNALNNYNGGKGWLDHNNWQLPINPAIDTTCSSVNTDNFGIQCTGSTMGNLYNVVLNIAYPDSVVPPLSNSVPPFINLQPGLYWTADTNNGGEATFSFNTGIRGGNTTQYNFFHVLPMTKTVLGPVPAGTGVLPYQSGPAAGKAVYDTTTGISWTLNANLPAVENFGVTDTITITAGQNGKTNGGTVTVPVINSDGTVHFSAVDPSNTTSGWIVAMNNVGYAGTNTWVLPGIADLKTLYADLGIIGGDTRLLSQVQVGQFLNLQPGFYWGCVADTSGYGLCDYTQSAPGGLEWSFNFDDGFEGTDLPNKQFYVMVYYHAL